MNTRGDCRYTIGQNCLCFYDHGVKLGTHYPDLKPEMNFGTGSGHPVQARNRPTYDLCILTRVKTKQSVIVGNCQQRWRWSYKPRDWLTATSVMDISISIIDRTFTSVIFIIRCCCCCCWCNNMTMTSRARQCRFTITMQVGLTQRPSCVKNRRNRLAGWAHKQQIIVQVEKCSSQQHPPVTAAWAPCSHVWRHHNHSHPVRPCIECA